MTRKEAFRIAMMELPLELLSEAHSELKEISELVLEVETKLRAAGYTDCPFCGDLHLFKNNKHKQHEHREHQVRRREAANGDDENATVLGVLNYVANDEKAIANHPATLFAKAFVAASVEKRLLMLPAAKAIIEEFRLHAPTGRTIACG